MKRSTKLINRINRLIASEAYQVFGVTLIGAFLPITDFRWPAKQVVGEGLSKLNGQWYSINDITVVQLKAWPFETLEELEDD